MPISFFEHIVMQPSSAPLCSGVVVPHELDDMLLDCFSVPSEAFPQSGLAFSDAIPTAVVLGNPDGLATFCSDRLRQTARHAWLSGQYLENVQLELTEPGGELLVIRFNPLYFNDISTIPTRTLRRRPVWSLEEIFGHVSAVILAGFAEKESAPEKIKALAHLLTNGPAGHVANHLLHEAIQKITARKGNLSIEGLAASLNVGYKWLERNFLQFTGVSPKEFARQQRFLHTYFDLLNQPQKDLPDIALENAFYDQNHLSKEFKKFTGCSPAWFRKHYGRARKQNHPS